MSGPDPNQPLTALGPAYERSPAPLPAAGRKSRSVRLKDYIHEHETRLWWVHSAWAFLFGIGVMILGAKEPSYVRIIVFHISFVWASSLFLPVIIKWPGLSPRWAERIRLLINYFNKNFYQQLLFFVIPIYYASTTFASRNVLFLLALCVSAVLSTLDIVYDRYLSLRWQLTAVFLAFTTFAAINVMLLVMWAISNHVALYLSAFLALAVFATMFYRFAALRGRPLYVSLGISGALLLLLVRLCAPFIPPAPLSLGEVTFGQGFSRQSRSISGALAVIPTGYQGGLAVLTPVIAPYGLSERIRHRWYIDGGLVYISREHEVRGGRKAGYRYWSAITLKPSPEPRTVCVDVETAAGQLIGRARINIE